MVGKKNLTTPQRNAVVQFLLRASVNGKPKRGMFKAAEEKFNISRTSIYRYWQAAKKQQEQGETINSVSGKITKGSRCKRVTLDLALLSSLHYTKRGSIRSLAVGLQCSKTTVGRWVDAGLIRAHTSAIRPDLTAPNKLLRLRFTLDALELDRVCNQIKFRNMSNTIHFDEKWFYMSQASRRFYLAPEEDEPHRSCQNKNFIQKIMFMCAVARPLFADNGDILFDGKIGIFPFTVQVPAQRKSKNRDAGTIETKAIQSINKNVIKDCMINKIIPAIISKWPKDASKDIFIQQDNARPHIMDTDPEFRAAASQSGFNIRMVQQPSNSPDTNVNDLGWFRSIQSLQVQTACKIVDDLVKAVEKSFEELSPTTLNNVFLSLQGCFIEIMKNKGHNRYKLPHLGKEALIRRQELPQNLVVPSKLAIQCISHLREMDYCEGIGRIMHALGMTQGDNT